GQQMVYDLGRDLFAHLQRRSLLFHTRNPVGDSMSRVTGDSWCVNTIVDSLLLTPIHSLILIIGMIVIMERMEPGLTLLSLVVAPFMAAASVWFARPMRAAARAAR